MDDKQTIVPSNSFAPLNTKRQQQIMLNDKEILERILVTFIQILIARKLITNDSFKNTFESLRDSGTDDLVFSITLFPMIDSEEDVKKLKSSKGKQYILKYIPYKLPAINKTSGILDFLKKYEDSYKFLVIKNAGQKVRNQLDIYKDIEVFDEVDLMDNILEHDLQPEFEPFDVNDKKKMEHFFKEYCCSKAQLMKMGTSDPVAKFLGLQPGQIVRIIRNSETSGKSVIYRVIKKTSVQDNGKSSKKSASEK
jgi:DNA-directed RNA polymerase subunit H (RpoH/RPB5)